MSKAPIPHSSIRGRIGAWLRAAAFYDLFPKFSARIRRLLFNPLGVLILAALAALLCGAFLHPQGYILAAAIVAVIALGVAWPWVSLLGLRGSISFDEARTVEGERVEAYLILRNRLPWAAYGLAVDGGLRDQVAQANEDVPSISIASAPGRRTARCRWTFVPGRRGVYPLATPRLTTGFPFGLWENKRALSVERTLLVWPRTYPVGPVPMVGGDQQIEGNVARNKVGSTGDMLGVRPYRRGDSPRRIHWAQSARHDRLIVCEIQANARPVVQLVLDADPAVHGGQGPDSSREWAIRVVASLAKGWLTAGAEVAAAWNGQIFPASSGPKQFNALLDSLAELPDSAGPSLSQTLAGPFCRNSTNTLQVIVTTDVGVARCNPRGVVQEADQRWVVLKVQGFHGGAAQPGAKPTHLPIDPWLLIDAPEQVPSLLRGGWKEAQHGS